MPLLKLDYFQKKFPELKQLLPKFDSYLDVALLEAQEKGAEKVDIVPAQVAKKLQIKEGLALGLLMLAEEQGLVNSAYQVFCPTTDGFLEEYKSSKDIPTKIECKFHDRPTFHDADEFLVDVVFHFAPQVLEENALAAHS